MPEADQEKRTAENYEITQAVRIGGKVLTEQEQAKKEQRRSDKEAR